MTASKLIDRLDGVRATGPGRWIAKCPAHEDRSPSLSIRQADDGKVLLHCFGNACGAADVVAAVGLEFADLFPPRDPSRHSYARNRSSMPAADALAAIDHEAAIVAVIGADMHEHRELDEPTWHRLAQAVHRIGDARAIVSPLRIKP